LISAGFIEKMHQIFVGVLLLQSLMEYQRRLNVVPKSVSLSQSMVSCNTGIRQNEECLFLDFDSGHNLLFYMVMVSCRKSSPEAVSGMCVPASRRGSKQRQYIYCQAEFPNISAIESAISSGAVDPLTWNKVRGPFFRN
jgi:hypothetical protein